MKRILSLTLALALALTLFTLTAGCSASQKDENAPTSTQQQAAPATSQNGPTEVTIWYPENTTIFVQTTKAKIEQFNKDFQGKYHLTGESIPRGNAFAYEDKINTAAAANKLPDVIAVDGPNVPNYAASGLVIPIDEYVTAESKADMTDASIEQNSYNGKMYGISIYSSSGVMYYNKKMFEQAGIRIPKGLDDAFTWEEYYQIAKKLNTADVAGTKLVMNRGEGLPLILQQFWISNGTDFMNKEGTQCEGYINSPQGIEAATYLQRFFTEKLANIDATPTEFQDVKAATWIANSAEMATFTQYPDLEWGVTYFPYKEGGKKVSSCGAWAYSVTKSAVDHKAAFSVVDYFTDAAMGMAMAEATKHPAARKSALDKLEMFKTYPMSIVKEQALTTAAPRPRTPVYPILSAKFSEAILDIFSGADVKTTLDNLAAFVDNEYKKNYAK